MKNVVKQNHFYHPEKLIQALEKFVENYNNKRYHESINNLTSADVYFGRSEHILEKRKQKKRNPSEKEDKYNQQKLVSL